MNNNPEKSAMGNKELEALKKECRFLKLTIGLLKKKNKKNQDAISDLMSDLFKGVEVMENAPYNPPSVSISQFAQKSGVNPTALMKSLKADGIIRAVKHTYYIAHPEAFAGMIYYKSVKLIGFTRYCLRFNALGVNFLNDYVECKGLKPKRVVTL